MVDQDIDFEKIEQWLMKYHQSKSSDVQEAKRLLTMIVFACSPLVKKIAFSLARRSYDPVEDLIQVGNIGLLKGILKYNLNNQNIKAFLSQSVIWEIKHYLRDKASMVKPPRAIIELAYRINNMSFDSINLLSVEDESSDENPQEQYNEATQIDRRQPISLDQLQFDDNSNSATLADSIFDEKVDYERELNEKKQVLQNAIKKLDEKQKDLIEAIYYDGISQKALAKKWNTAQSNISRLQKKTLKQLFEIITKIKEDDNK